MKRLFRERGRSGRVGPTFLYGVHHDLRKYRQTRGPDEARGRFLYQRHLLSPHLSDTILRFGRPDGSCPPAAPVPPG